MAIQQRLHTKLVQKLILTPSLQQAIKLLPMSTLELAEMLNQEVVENPMLEETPSDDIRANDQIAQTEREDGAVEIPKPTAPRSRSRNSRRSRTRSPPSTRSPSTWSGS
jgi:DNA-directed RNA polymerase specialized sigma54-like protein